MCSEVANKNIRRRAVVIFLVGGVLTFPVLILQSLAVSTFGITGRRSLARLLACALQLSPWQSGHSRERLRCNGTSPGAVSCSMRSGAPRPIKMGTYCFAVAL